MNKGLVAFGAGLGVSLPIAAAIVWVHSTPQATSVAAVASTVAAVTQTPPASTSSSPTSSGTTSTVPPVVTTTPVPTVQVTTTTPAPTTAAPPEGVLAGQFVSELTANQQCADPTVLYDNRSNTAVDEVTQTFTSQYYPKHKPGTYPSLLAGPQATVTSHVGIPAFGSKQLTWHVCFPGIERLQSTPEPDGMDGTMYEIEAYPSSYKWVWFGGVTGSGDVSRR